MEDRKIPHIQPERRRGHRKRKASGPPPLPSSIAEAESVVIHTTEQTPLSWLDRGKKWLAESAAGCASSVGFHVILLVILSFWLIPAGSGFDTSITMGFIVAEGDFDQTTNLDIEFPESKTEVSQALRNMSVSAAANRLRDAAKPKEQKRALAESPGTSSSGAGEPSAKNSGDGSGATGSGYPMPAGGGVRKGSFTAWTIPDDPEPREDYLIVIQVQLPEKVGRYRKEDLSGFMNGDDGYETPIGFFRGDAKFPKRYYGRFDPESNQFVIKIPGAAAKVKDEIQIQSRVLKEKQVLEIVF